jgi:DNA-binding MarR family transcriptional regulator
MDEKTRKEGLMEQSYFYLIRQVMAAVGSRATNKLKKFDIHPSQAILLLYVEKHEGQTQREISQALRVKPPTTAAMMKRMEKKNFLLRGQDETDKRKSRIYLTDYGKEICSLVRDAVVANDQELYSVFTEEETRQMKESLARLILYFEEEARREGYENQECLFQGFSGEE